MATPKIRFSAFDHPHLTLNKPAVNFLPFLVAPDERTEGKANDVWHAVPRDLLSFHAAPRPPARVLCLSPACLFARLDFLLFRFQGGAGNGKRETTGFVFVDCHLVVHSSAINGVR